jgi:hypothetical protein
MADPIFLIDPKSRQPVRVDPGSFIDLRINERAELEQWVLCHLE